MRRTMIFGLLALATSVLLGCNRNQPVTDVDPNAPTTVVVDNQGFSDMTIFVLEGGRRIRLGLANGNTQSRFRLPSHLVKTLTPLRFLADPIGSDRQPVSDEITVSPGDEVTLRIPPR